MKALRIHEYTGPLQLETIDAPVAQPGQVVVRNQFTSLNPIDPGRSSGAMREIFPLQFPWTPGGDISGIVESIGEGVTSLHPGDPVFGYAMAGGTYAELTAVDAAALTLRPAELTPEQAAATALVSQTALQALQLAEVKTGQTILIHAGSGGVGVMAIQLAHQAGARVITTAQSSQAEALTRLGADQVIDHTQQRFEDVLSSVDIVLDLVGGETLARSYAVVKRGGTLVTANQPPDQKQCESLGIRGLMVQTKVTTAGLDDFVAHLKTGSIVPVVDHVETLWSPETVWAKRPSGSIFGKIVFAIASN